MKNVHKYILTYWDNGCITKEFYTLDFCFWWINQKGIIHYDLVDTSGVVYHAYN